MSLDSQQQSSLEDLYTEKTIEVYNLSIQELSELGYPKYSIQEIVVKLVEDQLQ